MVRVLVVDDSAVFRKQITNALEASPGIKVVGTASTGTIALNKMASEEIDVVTLDLEMPEMNGLQILRAMKELKDRPKVIVFSSTTRQGAETALEALHEGARDIVTKPQTLPGEDPADSIRRVLVPKILQFSPPPPSQEIFLESVPLQKDASKNAYPVFDFQIVRPTALVIASSTGGPGALEAIFSSITGPLSIPILVVQHMPPVFTDLLARRLSEKSGVPFKEARHGDLIEKGIGYIAPGDKHLMVKTDGGKTFVELSDAPPRHSVRPCADYLFETASRVYGSKLVGIVLTGMGEDGLEGARAIKSSGGGIMIQNRESCVVFGMPGAVHRDGCFDRIESLEAIAAYIQRFYQI